MTPTLRPMTRNDIPAGLEFCRESGWNQTSADWELLLELAPNGALVAEVDGLVAGTVINVPYRPAFDWMAMMLVRASLRGQGVGRVLMNAALGMSPGTVRLDATDAGRRLYVTLGFEDEFTLTRWRRTGSSSAHRGEASAVPVAEDDWPEIARMDAQAFGADRLNVLRWCGRTAPEYSWVLRSGVGLQGFIFGRHGHNSEHLGPLVAASPGAAVELLRSCLLQIPERPITIDTPDVQEALGDALESQGFSRQRVFTRMARGGRATAGQISQIFAAAGPELA